MADKLVYDSNIGQWVIQADAPVATPEPAHMEQITGALRGVTEFEIMGLPLGVAGTVALVDYLKDRFLSTQLAQWGALGTLGLAWVVKSYGKGILGTKVADAAALLLTYEAIRDTVAGWIDGVWPASMGQHMSISSGGGATMSQGVVSEAERIAESIGSRYGRAFR